MDHKDDEDYEAIALELVTFISVEIAVQMNVTCVRIFCSSGHGG